MPSSSALCIHLGQAGVQMGNAFWELLCLEHAIPVDGMIEQTQETPTNIINESYFSECNNGKLVPRAIYVDFEPSVVDEVRVGSYRQLFNSDQLISGKEDSANNFARGRFTHGKHFINLTMEMIRKVIALTDNFKGFYIFHSCGGGTGSGFSSLLLDSIADHFGKKSKCTFQVYPAPLIASGVVEPYNGILTLQKTIGVTDCSFTLDNEALYGVCRRNMGTDIPTFTTVNRIIAQVSSSLTMSDRCESQLSVGLGEYMTNLVPYPRIHFPLVSYAPLMSAFKLYHEKITELDMTSACFSPHNQMLRCDPLHGKYMAVCLLYRGHVSVRDVNYAVLQLKNQAAFRFVDWCPTGFKFGINCLPPTTVPGSEIAMPPMSACMSTNTTSVAEAFARLERKFQLLFKRRAFVHWFVGEGMEEGEFTEAAEEINALKKDYEEAGSDTAADDGGQEQDGGQDEYQNDYQNDYQQHDPAPAAYEEEAAPAYDEYEKPPSQTYSQRNSGTANRDSQSERQRSRASHGSTSQRSQGNERSEGGGGSQRSQGNERSEGGGGGSLGGGGGSLGGGGGSLGGGVGSLKESESRQISTKVSSVGEISKKSSVGSAKRQPSGAGAEDAEGGEESEANNENTSNSKWFTVKKVPSKGWMPSHAKK